MDEQTQQPSEQTIVESTVSTTSSDPAPVVHPVPVSTVEPVLEAEQEQTPSSPETKTAETSESAELEQKPSEHTIAVLDGLSNEGFEKTKQNVDIVEPSTEPSQVVETLQQSEPATQPIEPLQIQSQQTSVVEKFAEQLTPRGLTEEETINLVRQKLKALSVKGNQSRSNRRFANHAKIVEYLKQHGYVTNNEIEKLCGVKNATAWKYLKELEAQNLIIQLGERGKSVRYRLREGTNIHIPGK